MQAEEERNAAFDDLTGQVMGVVNRRFEADARNYAPRAQARGKRYYRDMDDLQQETQYVLSQLLRHMRNPDWQFDDAVHIFANASAEAVGYIVEGVLKTVVRAFVQRGIREEFCTSMDKTQLESGIEWLSRSNAPRRYPYVVFSPSIGFGPAVGAVAAKRSGDAKKRKQTDINVEERASDARSTPPGIDQDISDIKGKYVYVLYPNYGWYWGIVTDLDDAKPGNVRIFHARENRIRSKPIEYVRNMIRRHGSQLPNKAVAGDMVAFADGHMHASTRKETTE